mmetsp:Transcript_16089/g.34737  ORF Transcript_16089/g.34737 Transcript_16089/m.34737 type:complete len:273 (+) Transcript_16089:79-897(+)
MTMASSRWKRFAFFDRKNLSLPPAVVKDLIPPKSSIPRSVNSSTGGTNDSNNNNNNNNNNNGEAASSSSANSGGIVSNGNDGNDGNGNNGNNGNNHHQEVDAALLKRKAIQSIMRDASLTDLERRLRIQQLMDGSSKASSSNNGNQGGSVGGAGGGIGGIGGICTILGRSSSGNSSGLPLLFGSGGANNNNNNNNGRNNPPKILQILIPTRPTTRHRNPTILPQHYHRRSPRITRSTPPFRSPKTFSSRRYTERITICAWRVPCVPIGRDGS